MTTYGYGLGRYGMGAYGIGEGTSDVDPTPTPTPVPDPGDDSVGLSVWAKTSTELWARVADIADYTALGFTPTIRDVGTWSMTRDYDDEALEILTDRLYTIDFRGKRFTWGIQVFTPQSAEDDEGGATNRILTVSGVGAYAMLGWVLTWPDPTKDVNDQPTFDPGTVEDPIPAPYTGPAETVIKQLVAGNMRDRYGADIVIPASQGRGGHIDSRPNFESLLELVTKYATDGGLGVDVGLVNEPGTDTRARLTLQVWEPEDHSKDVVLTPDGGAVTAWQQPNTAPTATRAVVAGAGTTGARRFMRWPVHTDASDAAAATWGGHREVFVDGPDSFDPGELIQAGRQAFTDGADAHSLAFTLDEDEGTLAFRDYMPGDTTTGQIAEGVSVVDVITAIAVTFSTDNGITIAPTLGNPDATTLAADLTKRLRALQQSVRRQERK